MCLFQFILFRVKNQAYNLISKIADCLVKNLTFINFCIMISTIKFSQSKLFAFGPALKCVLSLSKDSTLGQIFSLSTWKLEILLLLLMWTMEKPL